MTTPTTPPFRPRVSLAVAVLTSAALAALGACAHRPPNGGAAAAAAVVRFDNLEREAVRVYLVGERREWLLGRVEPGARALLRLPRADGPAYVRLAVVPGERLTLRAGPEVRAWVTYPPPAAALAARQWTFAQGQLTPLRPPTP
ncbi:hypothetical protein [Roseisolibacter sp. H3M3-2]|uniref:hypothetical protein n=1 Tax=Roseisolibacter sp. H3M3-2 TaxID=3031323 RepID=UPI0023DC0A89|nr:hypothetical protein [Roseisolibacter sp. H3M3-2]MDF1504761.1 hypothetical protein [Roseisolibacter sp. H3M3-2]